MPVPAEFIDVDPDNLPTLIPCEMADVPILGWGQESNIGTDMHGPDVADQLNIRWFGGWTYVQPVGNGNTVLPFKMQGDYDPTTCRAVFHGMVSDV